MQDKGTVGEIQAIICKQFMGKLPLFMQIYFVKF